MLWSLLDCKQRNRTLATKFSAWFPELNSTCTEDHIKEKQTSRKRHCFFFHCSISSVIFLEFGKVSSPFVKTDFFVFRESFCRDWSCSQRNIFLKSFRGLDLKLFWSSDTTFLHRCESCILRVPRNVFSKRWFLQKLGNVCVFRGFNAEKFQILKKILHHGCQSCLLRVQTIILTKKANSRRLHNFNNISGLRAEKDLIFGEIYSAFSPAFCVSRAAFW